MVTKDEAIKAAETLKEWCKRRYCGNCEFYSEDGNCIFREHPASLWHIPKPRRWSDADVQMAKAMKMYGYESVERLATGELVSRSSDIRNDFPPKSEFADLEHGESVSFDDIIREAEHV